MNLPQLLSPAKNKEVAFAAIQAGADAVYIGAPMFGARQAAGNSMADLEAVVKEASVYGVKVLVTINTLLDERERKQAAQMMWQLHEMGVYAIIMQDLRLLQEDLPPIRLHASTQCDNRTIEQVQALRDLGFSRVVLARELGIEQIRAIHQAVPNIELEVFVHGALCVSYSGRCYMSEVLMGRSANRGACAQMCRMAYDVLDKDGNEVLDDTGRPMHQRYILSLQDLDRSFYLHELMEAGVHTLKIEGRLKEADYVTNVTAYYRQALDALKPSDAPTAYYTYSFTPNPQKTFHRGGTDYFLHGRTRPLVNWQTPKSTGEYIGEVLACHGVSVRVRLRDDIVLHNGDGLCVGQTGFAVNGIQESIIMANKVVRETGALYRNADTTFSKSLHAIRKIPIDIVFESIPIGFRLTMGNRSMDFEAETVPATQPDKAIATLREQLGKLGDTPYIARQIDIRTPIVPFIPIKQLNTYRREVLGVLAKSEYRTGQTNQTSRIGQTGQIGRTGQTGLIEPIENSPLMTCKYCILYEIGHCRRENPLKNEPHFLRLANGTKVRLSFDCQVCEMKIEKI